MPALHGTQAPFADEPANGGTAIAKDPVCGMSVDPATAKHKAEHEGETYLFLLRRLPRESSSPTPRGTWRSRLARPAGAAHDHAHGVSAAAPPTPAPPGAIYTCPMHPQIRQDHPGAARSAAWRWSRRRRRRRPGPNAELVDMTRRFWVGARALGSGVRAGDGRASRRSASRSCRQASSNWMQFVLATPVVLWAGWPFFERGWASVGTAASTCSR